MITDVGTAIVTGYSSGLGHAIASDLVSRGWTVVGVARRSVADIDPFPDSGLIHHVGGAVEDGVTVEKAFQTADKIGGLKAVFNCAGRGVFGPIGTYDAYKVNEALAGGLLGLILFSDQAVSAFRAHAAPGIIVNIMSTAAKKYRPTESVYTAVKWGAKAYTRTLRDELKVAKEDIRVIEVYPCGMRSDFWNSAIGTTNDGSDFPFPSELSGQIVDAVLSPNAAYLQELTFERR